MTCVKAELLIQNRKAGVTLFAMDKITQTMRFRQAVNEYADKHGVTDVYRWRKRYDSTQMSGSS